MFSSSSMLEPVITLLSSKQSADSLPLSFYFQNKHTLENLIFWKSDKEKTGFWEKFTSQFFLSWLPFVALWEMKRTWLLFFDPLLKPTLIVNFPWFLYSLKRVAMPTWYHCQLLSSLWLSMFIIHVFIQNQLTFYPKIFTSSPLLLDTK